MRIWVIKTGEPVPFLEDERNDRFLRAGQMVRSLQASGGEVTWWAGQFDHMGKRQRGSDACIPDAPEIVLLPSDGYISHMGPARIRDHRQVARAFRAQAAARPTPDLILSAYPTPDLCVEAVKYGRAHGVPVVLDVRDLWPDIFDERLKARLPWIPGGLRRAALSPFYRMARQSLGQADGVISLAEGMLSWAQDLGGRSPAQRRRDGVFNQSRPVPVPRALPPDHPVSRYLSDRDPAPDGSPRIRLSWVGSLIPNTDAEALLAALQDQTPEMRDWLDFTICGRGPLAPRISALAETLPNLRYFEWLDDAELTALLSHSHIGLMCYLDRPDFQMSVPNKVVDYLAFGLRILTNLSGEVARLCEGTDIVLSYRTGSAESLLDLFGVIAADPERFRVRQEAATRIFQQRFDAQVVQRDFEAYLRGFVSRTAAPTAY